MFDAGASGPPGAESSFAAPRQGHCRSLRGIAHGRKGAPRKRVQLVDCTVVKHGLRSGLAGIGRERGEGRNTAGNDLPLKTGPGAMSECATTGPAREAVPWRAAAPPRRADQPHPPALLPRNSDPCGVRYARGSGCCLSHRRRGHKISALNHQARRPRPVRQSLLASRQVQAAR
jgi:hypothetical protein